MNCATWSRMLQSSFSTEVAFGWRVLSKRQCEARTPPDQDNHLRESVQGAGPPSQVRRATVTSLDPVAKSKRRKRHARCRLACLRVLPAAQMLDPFLSPPLHIHKVASTCVSIIITLSEAELEVTKHFYLFFPMGPHRLKPSLPCAAFGSLALGAS